MSSNTPAVRGGLLAMPLPLAGGMALALDQGLAGGVQLMGLLVVMLATAA